ncbi:helix-turn-helix transcriptional regulator [Caulobacter mirabilis]|uniref:Transcriptional regulator n=1 Tax=Caulobacter mirabilis TaxID=69666 RepID=A0A2D2AVZ9_9CAUL|nr:transcriptional regulator [Caulobacter mirabilis]ATQ42166.1 transcriptional regulator [Caulobacter mirabilis]
MRASRLLSILILLQLRGRLTAEALAEEFEVSVRTIYRDIDELSAAGVPVYAERGRAGGFALLDGYRTRLTGLTSTESDALVLAGGGAAAADLGLGDDLAAARLKLLASLPPDSGASAQKVAARFHLDPTHWYRRTETSPLLPALAEAVWADRRLRIRYDSWKGPVDRDIDPLGLVLKGGAWYLAAAVGGTPRTYRVSSLRALEPLAEPFQRPVGFDLAAYWSDWARDFEARLMSGRAQVRLSPEGLRRLRIISPAAAEAVDADRQPAEPAGWIIAEIPTEDLEDATRQLLYLGAEAEVLGPPDLREAVAATAARIAALYASPS